MKSSQSIWRYVVTVKSMVKILSIFVAFLENMNFNKVRINLTSYFVNTVVNVHKQKWPFSKPTHPVHLLT